MGGILVAAGEGRIGSDVVEQEEAWLLTRLFGEGGDVPDLGDALWKEQRETFLRP